METTVSMHNLTYSYDETKVLEQISLQATRGSVLAVLGPNGAGKSTLFRLIAGLLFPRDGELQLFGQDCRELYRNRPFVSGVCIDGIEPGPREKVKHLVALESGIIPTLDRAKFSQMLADAGIKQNQRYGQLSKGQKRWLLARLAMTGKRDLILLDEPGDGLDLQKRRALYDQIRDYANTHDATIIVATHILTDIERITDDVVVINDGQLRFSGDLETIREAYRIIRHYNDTTLPESLSTVEIIHQSQTQNETQLLAKADYDFWQNLETGRDLAIEPVTLESLYLTLTGDSGQTGADHE